MFIRKKEYEELKGKLESAKSDASHYKNMYEELQHKIDILYAYYDINKDPTQEERTKIRLDLRVHDLEMENLELRAAVNMQIGYLRNELNRTVLSTANSIY